MKTNFDYSCIADFLSSPFRERIIYELSTPKKRMKAFERFSHDADSVLNSNLIYFKGKDIREDLKSIIAKNTTKCTVMSFKYQEGKSMKICEAFDYLANECAVALICAKDFLVVKPEYEGGESIYYVLKKL